MSAPNIKARLHIKTSAGLGRNTQVWVESVEDGTTTWVDLTGVVTALRYNVDPGDLATLDLEVHPLSFVLHDPDWDPPEPPSPPGGRTGPLKQAPDVLAPAHGEDP